MGYRRYGALSYGIQIHLDTLSLDIYTVFMADSGETVPFSIVSKDPAQGDQLRIVLPRMYYEGDALTVTIKYTVDSRSKALNFLTKEQTLSKSKGVRSICLGSAAVPVQPVRVDQLQVVGAAAGHAEPEADIYGHGVLGRADLRVHERDEGVGGHA